MSVLICLCKTGQYGALLSRSQLLETFGGQVDGLVQDSGNSIANALESPQSRTKPLVLCKLVIDRCS